MLVPSCYVNGLDQHQTVENMAATALTWRWNRRLAPDPADSRARARGGRPCAYL